MTENLKQPKTFLLCSMVSLFERFGYYILTFSLTLYLMSSFKLPDKAVFSIMGSFLALTFLTPTFGGYVSDNILGTNRSIITGLILEIFGFLLISFKGDIQTFFLGCALIAVGVGLFKTGPSAILGKSYKGEKDPRMDSGFTYFYIFLNIGAIGSTFLAGILSKSFNYNFCFLCAAFIIFIGLIYYLIFQKKIDIKKYENKAGKESVSKLKIGIVILSCIVLTFLFKVLLSDNNASNITFAIIGFLIIIYLIKESLKLKDEERKKFTAAIFLLGFGVVFFLFYNQLFSSVIVFLKRVTNRNIGGHEISAIIFQSVNPISILIFGPILAGIYKKLGKNDFKITSKFNFGIFLTVIAFFLMSLSTIILKSNGKANLYIVISAIALVSIGELLTSALGFSMISKLVPKKMYGVMMGVWLVVQSMGAILSAKFANLVAQPDHISINQSMLIYRKGFFDMSLIGVLCLAVCILVAKKYLEKII